MYKQLSLIIIVFFLSGCWVDGKSIGDTYSGNFSKVQVEVSRVFVMEDRIKVDFSYKNGDEKVSWYPTKDSQLKVNHTDLYKLDTEYALYDENDDHVAGEMRPNKEGKWTLYFRPITTPGKIDAEQIKNLDIYLGSIASKSGTNTTDVRFQLKVE